MIYNLKPPCCVGIYAESGSHGVSPITPSTLWVRPKRKRVSVHRFGTFNKTLGLASQETFGFCMFAPENQSLRQ